MHNPRIVNKPKQLTFELPTVKVENLCLRNSRGMNNPPFAYFTKNCLNFETLANLIIPIILTVPVLKTRAN